MGGNFSGVKDIYEYLKIYGVISQLLVQRKRKGTRNIKVCLFVCFNKRKRKRKTLYRGRSFFNENIYFFYLLLGRQSGEDDYPVAF